jgi:hypothetical protein
MFGLIGYLAARAMRAAINRGSVASDALGLRMSEAKLKRLCPSLYFSSGVLATLRCLFWDGLGLRYYIRDMLVHGDSRAAVVLSASPLLVGCYSDDLDGVCVLRFPEDFAQEYALRPGGRLLTVLNARCQDAASRPKAVARDIVQGDAANPRYVNLWPLVAEFLSDELAVIEARKRAIAEREYERCRRLGEEHLRRFGGVARDGRPDRSELSA